MSMKEIREVSNIARQLVKALIEVQQYGNDTGDIFASTPTWIEQFRRDGIPADVLSRVESEIAKLSR